MSTTTTIVHGPVPLPTKASGWFLLVLEVDALEVVPAAQSGYLCFGRSRTADIVLNDGSTSRRHLRVKFENGMPTELEELGSVNGTRLNGEPVVAQTSVPLKKGDRIELGSTQILVDCGVYFSGRRRLVPFEWFEALLAETCARAALDAPLALVRWEISERTPWLTVAARLAGALPPPHVFTAYAERHYLGLLQGVSHEEAQELAATGQAALGAESCRFGVALAPRDATSAHALFERATDALRVRPSSEKSEMVGRGRAMTDALNVAARAAKTSISVLLTGETGVGKDVMARHIHAASPRRERDMLSLNCAGLSENLFEAELFGYERGAFTGATAAKKGLIETAHGSTIFFDEIGELPLAIQAKLLRVLESREVLAVGSVKPRKVDVRFIAATNRDLESECEKGAFRSDLFFRLAGIVIKIPPLRERSDELPALCRHFIKEACLTVGRPEVTLTLAVEDLLRRYEFSGNVRELKNILERAVILLDGDEIDVEHLPQVKFAKLRPRPSFEMAAGDRPTPNTLDERAKVVSALAANGGNQTRAARALGVSRKTLIKRVERYGIARPQKRSNGSDSNGN